MELLFWGRILGATLRPQLSVNGQQRPFPNPQRRNANSSAARTSSRQAVPATGQAMSRRIETQSVKSMVQQPRNRIGDSASVLPSFTMKETPLSKRLWGGRRGSGHLQGEDPPALQTQVRHSVELLVSYSGHSSSEILVVILLNFTIPVSVSNSKAMWRAVMGFGSATLSVPITRKR